MKAKKRASRIRADELMVAQGLVCDTHDAKVQLMTGNVFAGEIRIDKPGTLLSREELLELRESGGRFVSRGGEKLHAALRFFYSKYFPLEGKVCADLGASTGGFTDCMIQHGASRVYSIDVGYGLLHERLRNDSRVRVYERTNARHLQEDSLPESIDFVALDVSFIGIALLLPAIKRITHSESELVALIKPQYETTKVEAWRGRGVITDEGVRLAAITKVINEMKQEGFEILGRMDSVVAGAKGNIEHLVHARRPPETLTPTCAENQPQGSVL